MIFLKSINFYVDVLLILMEEKYLPRNKCFGRRENDGINRNQIAWVYFSFLFQLDVKSRVCRPKQKEEFYRKKIHGKSTDPNSNLISESTDYWFLQTKLSHVNHIISLKRCLSIRLLLIILISLFIFDRGSVHFQCCHVVKQDIIYPCLN